MKKIGRGWQYVVYDLENGRVRKQRYSPVLQYLKISKDLLTETKFFPFFEARSEQRRMRRDEENAVAYLKDLKDFDWKLLGNPHFISDGVYEQDKVTDLNEAFKGVTIEEGKKIFNTFLALTYATWEYGFSDKIFNFTINNGLTKNGEVIQLDFGELEFDKEEMRRHIREKCWLERYSYWSFPKGELKDYYVTMMNPEVMERKLDEVWGIKLYKF
ncbi:MAG: hypothetical protein JWN50_748 [Parcubacteria group bacterium]|nr:hypothetical protein [Parcubacteria group bacterium]